MHLISNNITVVYQKLKFFLSFKMANQDNSEKIPNKKTSNDEIYSKTPSFIFMNLYADALFYILILLVTLGSSVIYMNVNEMMKNLTELNSEYKFFISTFFLILIGTLNNLTSDLFFLLLILNESTFVVAV